MLERRAANRERLRTPHVRRDGTADAAAHLTPNGGTGALAQPVRVDVRFRQRERAGGADVDDESPGYLRAVQEPELAVHEDEAARHRERHDASLPGVRERRAIVDTNDAVAIVEAEHESIDEVGAEDALDLEASDRVQRFESRSPVKMARRCPCPRSVRNHDGCSRWPTSRCPRLGSRTTDPSRCRVLSRGPDRSPRTERRCRARRSTDGRRDRP